MSVDPDQDQIDALKAENQALADEIKTIKKSLGLDKLEKANERKRIQAMFTLYDVDGSGFIEKDEFQGLAVMLGLVLTPDAVAKAMTSAGAVDGKINFEQFFEWISNTDHGEVGSDVQEKDLMALKMKLGTSSFFKAAAGMARQVSKRVGENPIAFGKEYFTFRVGAQTVGLKNPNLRFGINYSSDAGQADALRASCGAEGSPLTIAIDLATSAEANDESVGELAGQISPLLDMGLQQLPLPFPVTHEEMFTANEAGEKVFRIVFKIGFDPISQAEGMLGFNPAALLKELSVVVEAACSLADVFKPGFNVLEAFSHHVAVGVSVDKAVVDTVAQVLQAQGAPPEVYINFQGIKALSEFELQLKTFSLAEVARTNQVVGMYTQAIAMQAPMYLAMAQQQMGAIPMMLPPQFHSLYSGVRKNIVGLRRVAIAARNAQLYVDVKGLDFVALLPSLQM